MRIRGRSFLGLIALVAKRDYVRTVRRRGFLVGTLMLPLGIGVFMLLSTILPGAASPGMGTGFPVGSPDATGQVVLLANESELELEQPASPLRFELLTRENGLQRLREGTAEEFYVIPPGYPDDPTVLRIGEPSSGFDVAALQRQAAQQQGLTLLLQATLL
nr:hypothetical protein [Chloroflexota bacterium]